MSMLAIVLVLLVALLHLWFLVLEMFLWTRPLGRKVFRLTPERAEQSKVLAANQGLYNGFLAAGLVWAVIGARSGRRAVLPRLRGGGGRVWRVDGEPPYLLRAVLTRAGGDRCGVHGLKAAP
jgi:hypothetical protein